MTTLPDRGRFGVLPLPALLLLLHGLRFNGRLRLSSASVTRTVDVRDGRPLRVAGTGLCTRLLARGLLTPEGAARVAARAPAHGGSEEKALLALRLLAPRDLWSAIREHEREMLLECFEWPEGEFELAAGEAAPAVSAALGHDPLELIHVGVSSRWSVERALSALGTAGERFASPGPGFEEARAALQQLSGADALCGHLDGRTRLADAVRSAGNAGAAAAALLLDSLNALVYADEPMAAEAAPSAPPAPRIEILVTGGTAAPASQAGGDRRAAGLQRGPARDAERDARRKLIERHTGDPSLDHYALLGVARTADAAAVRHAYVSAAKTFHPDAIARLGLEDLREQANALFVRIGTAHGVLSDPARRREYDESLAGGGLVEAQRIANAETLYRKGEVLLRKGSFDEALRFLRPAADLGVEDAAYHCALGWALYKKQQSEPDSARAELERAIALDPTCASAHLRLATVLRDLGKGETAARHFARARELEPGAPR